ncbi:MAG: GGDEF domain-containing protein [Betaproteobacteria bacterium]
MIELGKFIDRAGERSTIVMSLTLLLAIAVADYLTGADLSLSSLYLIPVMLVAWRCSGSAGIAMALAAYALLLGVNLRLERAATVLPYVIWEGAIRFGTALLFVYVLSKLRFSLEREKLLARSDSLTGLANRSAFYDLVNREMARCRRYGGTLSIAFIDMDNFKELNDKFGHLAGDEALRVVAGILREQLRSTDLPARFGGDEFAVMLTQSDAHAASQATHALRSRLLSAMRDRNWSVTFSAGLATFEKMPESFDDMIKRADALMYAAKQEAKGTVREHVFR